MTPITLIRRMPWKQPTTAGTDNDQLLTREWLVTNGLGGYASGTVSGVATRRYHGLLTSALPAPHGRTFLLAHLSEQLRLDERNIVRLGGEESAAGTLQMYGAEYLEDFWLESGLPVWKFRIGEHLLEKRVFMPHQQNTVYVRYRLLEGSGPVRLKLLPTVHFRPHEFPVSTPLPTPFTLQASEERFELSSKGTLPPLRMQIIGDRTAFTYEQQRIPERIYRIEESRGYESSGDLWSPGYFRVDLDADLPAAFVASTESWETVFAIPPEEILETELLRRRRLIAAAPSAAKSEMGAELVLAADQFLIKPAGRVEDVAVARAAGDEARTVIAGYHWFTDWGRDTMISLEGLTLCTGRQAEAGSILRTFAHHVHDGLIPNLFPEGDTDGLYHTADASLWFFHALDRYLQATNDRVTLDLLLPKLLEIVDRHLGGTRFGIGVDPKDGLLRQGAEGYQLTWMDAKVGDWVVTPRRGKAVEINALWYNALRLLERWLRETGNATDSDAIARHAEQVQQSFNQRFWYSKGGYLYDIVDGEQGNDAACRPNQIFAISLPSAVLQPDRWPAVLNVVENQLLTPMGLRSLAPEHPDYKPKYDGDLRSRDAAYHQGTVWGWLIGPFIDAWLKVHPTDLANARAFLQGFTSHLGEAGIGSISEIFDAEAPYWPRGCIAQAWSVAEVLRCWIKTAEPNPTQTSATELSGVELETNSGVLST